MFPFRKRIGVPAAAVLTALSLFPADAQAQRGRRMPAPPMPIALPLGHMMTPHRMGPVLPQPWWWRHQPGASWWDRRRDRADIRADRGDVRRDNRAIRMDQARLSADRRTHNTAAVTRDEEALRSDLADRSRDLPDLHQDRADLRADRRWWWNHQSPSWAMMGGPLTTNPYAFMSGGPPGVLGGASVGLAVGGGTLGFPSASGLPGGGGGVPAGGGRPSGGGGSGDGWVIYAPNLGDPYSPGGMQSQAAPEPGAAPAGPSRRELEEFVRTYLPDATPRQVPAVAAALARLGPLPTPAEVASGEALNALLRDIARAPSGGPTAGSPPLREEVLRRLNVTSVPGGSLAAFRNPRLFDWPAALRAAVGERERRDLEAAAEDLYRQAQRGPASDRLLRKLDDGLAACGAALRGRAQELPMDQYLQARQLLNDLGKAAVALRGGVGRQAEEFKDFVRGGRLAHEVAGHMIGRGLTFAPAAPGDEDAYFAAYVALAQHRAALAGVSGS